MGYYFTIQSCSLKAAEPASVPDGWELADGSIEPPEYHVKSTVLERDLVTLSKSGVTGTVEVSGESGEWLKMVLKGNGTVEVYEGAITYGKLPSEILDPSDVLDE